MTEYWVSQGNKWCDTCKIYISNNPASIRNHELGQRHKDNVAKRLNAMREDKASKEKEQKQAAKVLEQIEAKAERSYQKDLAAFQEARKSNAQTLIAEDNNQGTSDGSTMPGGKWVTQEEALAAFQASSGPIQKRPSLGKPPSASENRPGTESKNGSISESGPPPGRVVSTSLNPMRSVKGATSSLAVKRKRPDEKPKAVSKEEAAALKAREAARKRVEEREKSLLGLYRR